MVSGTLGRTFVVEIGLAGSIPDKRLVGKSAFYLFTGSLMNH
jgi:hypothetical protein